MSRFGLRILFALAVLGFGASHSAKGATLSHRWSFGGSAADSVGGAHGILVGDADIQNGELVLDGTGDRMDFSSTIGIGTNFGATGVTIESWYTDTGSGIWAKLFTFGSANVGQELAFTHRRAGQTTGVDRDGAKLLGFDVSTGTEHHLVITVSADGNLNTWLDGSQVLTSVNTNNLSNVTSQNEFLGDSAWADPQHRGSINEFRIWSGELTPAEVAASGAAGPDSLPGDGPVITSFTAQPAARYEGEQAQLSWTIDAGGGGGSLAWDIRGPGGSAIHSGTAASGSFVVTMPETGGAVQDLAFLMRAWDTSTPADVTARTATVRVDPGIPSAQPQSIQAVAETPRAITLTGSDPNALPAPLTFRVTQDPSAGSLSGSPPNLTYSAPAGFAGIDAFRFVAEDGKYTSPEAVVSIDVVPPPSPPTAITLSTNIIFEDLPAGGLAATMQAADPNPGDTHTFALVAGAGSADNASFRVVGSQLRAEASVAGQVGRVFSLRIRTTDSSGLSFESAVALTVVEASAAVVINEVHYNPPDNTVRQEFIELFNPGDEAADLSGGRLSGAVDFVFPAGTSIPAGGYLVVAEDPATLAATLNASALGPFDGSLSSEGETVRLRDADDVVVDEVDYKVGFPWPVSANSDGPSIELVHPKLDNSLGSSWRSSTPPAALDEATLVPLGSSGWSWRPGTSEASQPDSEWRRPGFIQDGSWTPDAAMPIGYGAVGSLAFSTTISGMQQNYTCIFLRRKFTIAPGEIPSQLLLRATIDDAAIVWINGVEAARWRFPAGVEPSVADTGANQPSEGAFDSATVVNAGSFLIEGENTIAVQVFNTTIGSSDLGFDIDVVRPGADDAIALPTPGARNSAFAENAAPNIRKVNHSPEQAASGEPIQITALVTDPEGVAGVTLEYQTVAPGAYIPSVFPSPVSGGSINLSIPRPENPAYDDPANWTSIEMRDNGTGGDALAGDDLFTAVLPPQAHRTLVRYRITVEDGLGLSARVPYPDDPSLNFACFIYDGVPDYAGTAAEALQSVPVYHLITRGQDYSECIAYSSADQIAQGTEARFAYNWNGTIVYDGKVYDHIRYRLRGANGRYHGAGKRSMRFRFNDGNFFEARDQSGQKYPRKWRTLTTGKGFDNRSTLTYGLNEAVSMHLFNQVGVPASDTHWIHWRVIDGAAEAPDAWRGDFHGLYFVLETYDVRFLEAHDLEKGNLYKLINQTGDWERQQRYQAAFALNNGADHTNIEQNLDGADSAAYIDAHVNLDRWNRWHAMVEAIRHYDFWPSANKNMVYYFEPLYTAANGNRGKLWILPWDTDASWGPTWNEGHDVVYNALFPSGGAGGDPSSTPELWPEYFNMVREVRDLLWQPDQIESLVDEFAAVIAPLEAADSARWKNAPADAGSYSGLGGQGAISLAALVQDMKNFAFVGGNWPGGGVGAGGRAAHLDALQASNGEGSRIPAAPTITSAGAPSFPANGISLRSSAFADPQGGGTFGAMEWRLAEVTDPNAPAYDPNEPLKLEWNAAWESGALPTFSETISVPSSEVRAGHTYRARVRHQDSSGRWSHWSAPLEFTATLPDISAYLAGLVVSEIMYHPADPSPAETAAGFTDDGMFEFIELFNAGSVPLDLADIRFTKGVDFDFLGSDVTALAPDEFAVVVSNRAAFEMRYGAGLPIAGEWEATDQLSNGGERLKLSFGAGEPIRDFDFDDAAPWPTSPDGAGPSLTLIGPEAAPDPAVATNWRASFAPLGTPASAENDDDPFAAWLAAQGSGDPLAPFSGSSLPNLVAFAVGADLAANPEDALPSVTTAESGGLAYPALTYRLRSSLGAITVTAEVSEDLSVWTSGPGATTLVGAPQDNGDGTVTLTVRTLEPLSADADAQYLRLRVSVN